MKDLYCDNAEYLVKPLNTDPTLTIAFVLPPQYVNV